MHKNDTILQYLSRCTQVHDKLARVGVTISQDEFVREDEEKIALARKGKKGKGKKYKTKQNSNQGGKKKDLSKENTSIFMNMRNTPQSVHTKGLARIPQEEQQVKPWLHKLSLTLALLHACLAQGWGACGTLTKVNLSI